MSLRLVPTDLLKQYLLSAPENLVELFDTLHDAELSTPDFGSRVNKKQGRTLSARPLYKDTLNCVGWNDGGPALRQGFHRFLRQSNDRTTFFDVIPPFPSRRVAR